MMKKATILWSLAVPASVAAVQGVTWPEPTNEMKPWVYNWWMGSAVDAAGLEYQCAELEAKGFGGFHVIPIYGANGPANHYRKQWRDLLSPEWVEAWNLAARKARAHNLGIDLTMGSGWCFGGPWIPAELGASSGQKVKRAGPGGAGFMIDPFNPEAMRRHLSVFEPIFGKGGTAERPRAFYHDSYEYYGAKPRDPDADIDAAQLATFKVWTDWCRENGYLTRNEAHGAPSNWLDFYALADIPETEMFGKKDRDILISKFASSAAHVKGTRLVSAESCTWVDEHFNERPAEIKAFIDRLFLSGVNHVFYHGLCYSPVDATWPGWCFYASLEMNPRNPIWREAGALNAYITRCQSLFQTWTPDNDILVLWDPDTFRRKEGNYCKQMSVHGLDWFYGEKIGPVAKRLYDAGYCFDYISPRQLTDEGIDKTRYAVLVDPERTGLADGQTRYAGIDGAEPILQPCRADNPSGLLSRRPRPMPFDKASGLLATRWKTPDGQTAYFVVNPGEAAREVRAESPFTLMAPMSGMIVETTRATIKPNHSFFLVGDGFTVGEPPMVKKMPPQAVAGPWTVRPVEGGPMPSTTCAVWPRTEVGAGLETATLDGWETWDEAFSGTMRYTTTFDVDATGRADFATGRVLDLGDVREIARVRLNGLDLGVRFLPPYRFGLPPGLLKEKGNQLEVEVTNLGANRLRHCDRTGVEWKYFADINMVDINYKKLDASSWPVLKSGLIGPVVLD